MRRVRKVRVPPDSLVAAAFEATSYADAYAINLPAGRVHDVDELTRLLATSSPRWAEWLMWLRDRIVSVIGLRTSQEPPTSHTDAPLQPGDRAGIFTVFARSSDELVFGGDDKHLDFRASVLIKRGPKRESVVLSTVVHYKNWLGRTYFFFVKPFHRAIVTSILRNMVRRLRETPTG